MPKLPTVKFSKDNLKELSEYFNREQKNEIKNILELFEIDWTIDLDNLKHILNKISEQIDKNNSTALFAENPTDVKQLVSLYRPIVNKQHHNMAYAYSMTNAQ